MRVSDGKNARKEYRRKLRESDPRVTSKGFSWVEFFALFIAIQIITSGQVMVIFAMMDLESMPIPVIAGASGYCALMALIVCGFAKLSRSRVYDRPLRLLASAARDITQGDFSVRLPEIRKNRKKDQMAVLFEDFNLMAEELGSIETLKDDFIGNVSHEIKTPLAVIKNYAAELKKENIMEEQREECLEVILQSSDRLSVLVSNILKLNRLENQGIIPDSDPYDLSEQLRGSILAFEDALEAKGIEIEVDIDDEIIVDHDEALLDLVWSNLLSNAIKFTDHGGTIIVRQRADLAGICVEVIDTGCGIDEDAQKHIFDKFYQGDVSHAQEGNGLGLALALKALRLVDGEIIVTSSPQQGSTFAVWLKSDGTRTAH